MSPEIDWRAEYAALATRLPEIVRHSRLTLGGFSTCVDIYLSLRAAMAPLAAAAKDCPQGAAMLAELARRAASGIGGELFVDWPEGPAWIDRHVEGRQAIGGTSAQAAYMLASLGARALIAVEDRSARQLAVLHPAVLLAGPSGLLPVAALAGDGPAQPPHYIFEFTAGETIAGVTVPRSSRTIVRFDHSALQRDPAFVASSLGAAATAGAGILCGFNELPPSTAEVEIAYAAGIARAWRSAGLALVHVELGDFDDPAVAEVTVNGLLPEATSVGMSRSELAHFATEGEAAEATAIRFAERHGLTRVCVHADEWAFTVSRDDPDREREALAVGCLLAATRAANGYFATPTGAPAGAQFMPPPLPPASRRGDWSIACCPAPWLEKPAATIGLGDTFLAGTLLVLGAVPQPSDPALALETP